MYAVILAGGAGERFWPMSTSRRPKQFLSIPHEKPLICLAVERIAKLIPQRQVFIITRESLVGLVHRVLPSFPKGNIIGEPCGRDTAAAIALGAALVKSRNPRAAFCVLTSDHVIGRHDLYRKTLRASFRIALSTGCLITIGIKPGFASTGFGYIEAGHGLKNADGIRFFKVKRFIEKPVLPMARHYAKAGKYYWNSGMFIWSVMAFEKAIAMHRPQLTRLIDAVAGVSGAGAFKKVLKKEYGKLEKISIDYAVMEHADNIVMAKASFPWDDVGSWSALSAHCRQDARGNVILGRGEVLDARDNIVVAEDGMVALLGVKDLVVVRSGAATLVCAKNRAQDVKKVVKMLVESGRHKGII